MKFKNGAKDRILYAIPVAVFQAPQYFKRENVTYAESGSTGTDQLVSIIYMNQFEQMNASAISISKELIDEFFKKGLILIIK
ncbi:MAG: hypothetical protein MTP17_00125 [Candidatus Midichloria sp.]|nr:MAG: hypothetical protein MTP17_00125 [Candidatus Midichloria sp.]